MGVKILKNMERLQELKLLEQDLRNKLSDNLDEQRKINEEDWCLEYGVRIGDTVVFETGRDNTLIKGILTGFIYSQSKINYPMVTLFKKDGKIGTRSTRVWTFEQKSLRKLET